MDAVLFNSANEDDDSDGDHYHIDVVTYNSKTEYPLREDYNNYNKLKKKDYIVYIKCKVANKDLDNQVEMAWVSQGHTTKTPRVERVAFAPSMTLTPVMTIARLVPAGALVARSQLLPVHTADAKLSLPLGGP